jgi:hypothetical protein
MTGPDHYRLAEELIADRGVLDDLLIGTAVHATLALAAATRHGQPHSRTRNEPSNSPSRPATGSCTAPSWTG